MNQKPNLHFLVSDYSTEKMHMQADRYQKAYQGHLTFDQHTNMWVAWATYGPYDCPDRSRAIVGCDHDLFKAAQMLDKRLEQKSLKGYALIGGGSSCTDMQILHELYMKHTRAS